MKRKYMIPESERLNVEVESAFMACSQTDIATEVGEVNIDPFSPGFNKEGGQDFEEVNFD